MIYSIIHLEPGRKEVLKLVLKYKAVLGWFWISYCLFILS